MNRGSNQGNHGQHLTRLRIWQQNTNRSLDAQSDLLHKIQKYSIVLIQEPHIDFLGNSRATNRWRTVYPTNHINNKGKTRSLILVNTLISTDAWRQIRIEHQDITAIEIQSGEQRIRIFNVYNSTEDNDTIQVLQTWFQSNRADNRNAHIIFAGDFNRHHPLWELQDNTHLTTNHHQEFAQPLLDLTTDWHMLLPAEIPTLEALNTKNQTRPDNVFCSTGLTGRVVYCKTNPSERPPKTDHYPIQYELDVTTFKPVVKTRRDYRTVDWKAFAEELTTQLALIPTPEEPHDIETFETCRINLENAIENTVEAIVKEQKRTRYSKRWFGPDLKEKQQQLRTAARASYRHRNEQDHPSHDAHRLQRHQYAAAIRQAKKECWNNWLEKEVSNAGNPWAASRLAKKASSDGGQTRMPELETTAEGQTTWATTNEEKSRALYNEFFQRGDDSQLPELRTPSSAHHRTRKKFPFTTLTNEQVERSLKSLRPNKATKPGTPHNNVLRNNAETLTPYLAPLFRATFSLDHYPGEWSTSSTIVLPKPSKPDYRQPGAYRPITLSHGLGRAINKCVKDVLQYHCERTNLIPPRQYGARPGKTAMDAVLDLTTMIKQAWRRKEVVSALFLDVKGAFPSVKCDTLTKEMEALGIPREYTQWLQRRLDNRWTTLAFDDYESEPFEVTVGLDQGCPGSPLYWILYCTPLLTLLQDTAKVLGFTFVDDHTIAARANNFEETHTLIESMLWRDGGIMDWAHEHNCKFGINKFQLVDFTRQTVITGRTAKGRPIRTPVTGDPIEIDEQPITPQPSARLLGITIDAQLKWNQQLDQAVKKGRTWLKNFTRLSRANGGATPDTMRRYYEAIAIPSMLYGTEVFLTPQRTTKKNGVKRRVVSHQKIKLLAQIQRQAGISICGAMRSTSNENVDYHASLTPIVATVDRIRQRAAV